MNINNSKRRACRFTYIVTFLYIMLGLFVPNANADPPSTNGVDQAIASLRHIKYEDFDEEKARKKSDEINQAWRTITIAGREGVDRLKAELKRSESEKPLDEFFRLNAARLLWQIRLIDEADTIAHVFTTTPFTVQYDYVFDTAFLAARSQHPKVLPILKSILHDDKGTYYVVPHSMNLTWPMTHTFVWGAYGSKGLPSLLDLLKTSKDSIELKSVVILLTVAQDIDALPEIRRIAKNGPGDSRLFAIEWLGEFGHPQDYEFLVGGLSSKDNSVVQVHVRALNQYEDLRAVLYLVPQLKSQSKEVRSLVIGALRTLVTDESLVTLHEHSQQAKNENEQAACKKFVDVVLNATGLQWDEFFKMPSDKRQSIIRDYDQREASYKLKPDDRKLTHKGLVKAMSAWRKANRITGGEYQWVESRHVLSVAVPADLDSLIDVRAAVLARLSDECLEEVGILNDLIRRVGRSRYRKEVGICEKVELPLSSTTSKEPAIKQ